MLKVKLDASSGFDAKEKSKLLSAIALLEKVVNSEEFRARVLNYTYNGNKTFVDNNGMSNELIYNLIMSGKEVLKPTEDHELNINITIYSSFWNRNVIGYTYPNTLQTWINRRYYKNYTPADICANIAHEYLHKASFNHSFAWTPSREFSVPYAIGYIVGELARRNTLTPIQV